MKKLFRISCSLSAFLYYPLSRSLITLTVSTAETGTASRDEQTPSINTRGTSNRTFPMRSSTTKSSEAKHLAVAVGNRESRLSGKSTESTAPGALPYKGELIGYLLWGCTPTVPSQACHLARGLQSPVGKRRRPPMSLRWKNPN